MKRILTAVVVGLCITLPCAAAVPATEEEFVEQLKALHWIKAPASAPIADKGHLTLTGEMVALGAPDTDRFLQMNGNLPEPNSWMIAAGDLRWFAVFSFDETGYVKDDEEIDPDGLLDALKEQDKAAAAERKRLGLEQLTLEGWYVSPHYDTATKQLEWGTRLRDSQNKVIVNYSTRLLGRRGVMNAMLVSNPETLQQDLSEFRGALGQFTFDSGEKYAEFKDGDKIAEYGLAALVVGAAAAAAMKGGAGFFKLIGLAIIGAFAAAWRLIKRLFNKES